MPLVSQAQRGLMHGIANGDIPAGGGNPPAAVAKEFAASDKGGKLPERKKKPGTRSSRMYKAKGVSGQKRMAQAAQEAQAAQGMPPGVQNG